MLTCASSALLSTRVRRRTVVLATGLVLVLACLTIWMRLTARSAPSVNSTAADPTADHASRRGTDSTARPVDLSTSRAVHRVGRRRIIVDLKPDPLRLDASSERPLRWAVAGGLLLIATWCLVFLCLAALGPPLAGGFAGAMSTPIGAVMTQALIFASLILSLYALALSATTLREVPREAAFLVLLAIPMYILAATTFRAVPALRETDWIVFSLLMLACVSFAVASFNGSARLQVLRPLTLTSSLLLCAMVGFRTGDLGRPIISNADYRSDLLVTLVPRGLLVLLLGFALYSYVQWSRLVVQV